MYAAKTLKHYLRVFARRLDITDSDCFAEIDGLCEDIEEQFEKLQERVKALEEAEEQRQQAESMEFVTELYRQ